MEFEDLGRVWREEGTGECQRIRVEDLSSVHLEKLDSGGGDIAVAGELSENDQTKVSNGDLKGDES